MTLISLPVCVNGLTVSARGVFGLWKRAMDQQQQVQPQQQQEVERWREYYYAPASKVGSDVYICSLLYSSDLFRPCLLRMEPGCGGWADGVMGCC